jgi:hypothetical protein
MDDWIQVPQYKFQWQALVVNEDSRPLKVVDSSTAVATIYV